MYILIKRWPHESITLYTCQETGSSWIRMAFSVAHAVLLAWIRMAGEQCERAFRCYIALCCAVFGDVNFVFVCVCCLRERKGYRVFGVDIPIQTPTIMSGSKPSGARSLLARPKVFGLILSLNCWSSRPILYVSICPEKILEANIVRSLCGSVMDFPIIVCSIWNRELVLKQTVCNIWYFLFTEACNILFELTSQEGISPGLVLLSQRQRARFWYNSSKSCFFCFFASELEVCASCRERGKKNITAKNVPL